jgi:thymidylate synthase
MKVLRGSNVNDIYRAGCQYLAESGEPSPSRNGPVLVSPEPVTSVYMRPLERVLFSEQRSANPFFHLFESLWMLAGRNDVETVAQFVPSVSQFSDNGETFHGAYGHRWRHYLAAPRGRPWDVELDQLNVLVNMLKDNPRDRRAILMMWDVSIDLNADSKDIPCNDLVKFRIVNDRLDMYVFCRSNDIVYGCYGANAVQFSFLLEYMALRIGVVPGIYEQISADFHSYTELPYKFSDYFPFNDAEPWINPYAVQAMQVYPLIENTRFFDSDLEHAVNAIRDQSFDNMDLTHWHNSFFAQVAQPMYKAFRMHKQKNTLAAAESLAEINSTLTTPIDWLRAGSEWLHRRCKVTV